MGRELDEHMEKFDFYRKKRVNTSNFQNYVSELKNKNLKLEKEKKDLIKTNKNQGVKIWQLNKKIKILESRLASQLPINYVESHNIKKFG